MILAITLHEAAHAFVAARLGDRTAELQGRVTLNPLRHIDLVGTLLVPEPFRQQGAGRRGLLFGWAKPVPIVASNLRSPRRHMGVVAAAGPGANIAMAVAWALALKLTTFLGDDGEFLARMAIAGIFVNFALAALNLMPVPPLDGGRILASLLPHRLAVPSRAWSPTGCSFSSRCWPAACWVSSSRRWSTSASVWSPRFFPFPTMFPERVFPACAPPARCTWATTTVR